MSRARAATAGLLATWLALAAGGCDRAADLALDIRFPADKHLLQAVARVNLSATRDGVVLASSSTAASSATVSLSGLSHGARTVIQLDGVDASGTVIARGRTCPVDFEASGTRAPLYFAPTNFFAPTAGAPAQARTSPVALALDDGNVLLAGGSDGASPPGLYATSERFAPGAATFSSGAPLAFARYRAEAVAVPSVGVLVTGGLDSSDTPLANAELYSETQQAFLPISDARLQPGRVGHRVSLLTINNVDYAFVSGGSNSDGGTPLDSTLLVYVTSEGGAQVSAGPTLYEARSDHAATVAFGLPVVVGGRNGSGGVLDSIEALDPSAVGTTPAKPIAHLRTARAEATASLLADGSILIVGGVGASGPLADAELLNPLTLTTTVYTMGAARHGHTATVLSDGRVLVAGGYDALGAPLASVELFASGVGFLTERSLGTARAGHAAVSLCDGTVLVVGGGAGAELYSEPAN